MSTLENLGRKRCILCLRDWYTVLVLVYILCMYCAFIVCVCVFLMMYLLSIILFCPSISPLAALYQISFCSIYIISFQKNSDESSSEVLNHWTSQLNVHHLTNRHRGNVILYQPSQRFRVTSPSRKVNWHGSVVFFEGVILVVFMKNDLVYGMACCFKWKLQLYEALLNANSNWASLTSRHGTSETSNLHFSTLLDWASKFFGDLPPSWTRKKLWNSQKDSKTTRWQSINSTFWVSQFFTLLDTHWSNMAQSYWIPKMHLSIYIYIFNMIKLTVIFGPYFWLIATSSSVLVKLRTAQVHQNILASQKKACNLWCLLRCLHFDLKKVSFR